MNRRQFLRGVGIGSLPVLAGCNEDGSGGQTTDGTGGSGDGGDENIFGDGDGNTQAATPADGGGTTQTATAGDGGGTTTEAGTPRDTETETTELTPSETATGPTLGAQDITFEDNFRFRIDYSNYDRNPADMSVLGEWNRRDLHLELTYEGDTMDVYYVGNATYLQASGYCGTISVGDQVPELNPRDWAETNSKQKRIEEWSDLEATGQTTLEGQSVWVYNFRSTVEGEQYEFTYYVSGQSGRLRRVEVQGIVIDYWDWGTVGPISAPC
ncbi:MAG: hypothetical protein V5A24_03240 [Haloarculaceae archaeon]